MKLRGLFIVSSRAADATAALAAPGIVTTTVSLRAGPGEGFPTVDRIPGGARVNIHGCLRGTAWCDVSWSDDRGWVSSQYLEYLYRNRYVYLPDYVDEIDVPVVPFALTSTGRATMRDVLVSPRAYWSGYWQSHERFATRLTIDRAAARIGARQQRATLRSPRQRRVSCRGEVACPCRGTDAAGVTERTRAGVTERVTREKTSLRVARAKGTNARRCRPARRARTRDDA